MGSLREQEDRRQRFLLPPSPSDWLPENHLAWLVIDAVEQLDIDHLLRKCRVGGKGEQAYPLRVMLALLIHAYCTGTFASRKIAAQIEDSVAFRVIAAGLSPSHRTICRFREENLDEFQRLFVDRRQQGEGEREQAQGDELRPHAARRVEAADEEAEADKRERVLPQPGDQEDFTDPDSRIMPTGGRSFAQTANPRTRRIARWAAPVAAP